METAVLRLGLAGFGAGEQQVIRDIAARSRTADWLCGTADGADAWLVNGAQVTGVQDSRVRVACADASGRMVPIVIDSTSRPTAFAKAAPGRAPANASLRFDLAQAETVSSVLRQFERELHPAKTCFWTAAHIIANHATIGKAMFELHDGAEVLATVDMKGDAAVSPTAAAGAFDRATWRHRARKAVNVPDHFRRCTLSELMWQYTTRTRRDLLPPRYRDCHIFFRRPPRVDARLIADIHLLVTRQLAIAPCTLGALQAALGIEQALVARALADLYFVGSITSNAERAWQGSVRSGLSSHGALLDADDPTPAYKRAPRETPNSTAPLL